MREKSTVLAVLASVVAMLSLVACQPTNTPAPKAAAVCQPESLA